MGFKFVLKYFRDNWKVVIHLLFRTKRFGVNNFWWNDFDSMFGWPKRKIIISTIRIYPIIENYWQMKFRGAGCHFVSGETAKGLGWHHYWKKKKMTPLKVIYKLLKYFWEAWDKNKLQ